MSRKFPRRVLQCFAVSGNHLQCVAVCEELFLNFGGRGRGGENGSVQLFSVLQCVAVCCSVLQCGVVYCSFNNFFRLNVRRQHGSVQG